jgi:hypothetical protein
MKILCFVYVTGCSYIQTYNKFTQTKNMCDYYLLYATLWHESSLQSHENRNSLAMKKTISSEFKDILEADWFFFYDSNIKRHNGLVKTTTKKGKKYYTYSKIYFTYGIFYLFIVTLIDISTIQKVEISLLGF